LIIAQLFDYVIWIFRHWTYIDTKLHIVIAYYVYIVMGRPNKILRNNY